MQILFCMLAHLPQIKIIQISSMEAFCIAFYVVSRIPYVIHRKSALKFYHCKLQFEKRICESVICSKIFKLIRPANYGLIGQNHR